MTMAGGRQRGGKGPVRVWLGRVVKVLAGLFVAFHLYALLLKFAPAPGTILMVQRAISGETIRRDWVPLEDISPYLVSAVIAAEDTRYCQHHGVDPEAIEKAIGEYKSGKGVRGASTITQQTAKNVFFWNGGGAPRKAGDMWMATFVDFAWGKRRVMEVYLNVAEWGDGIFGAEAAAQARFGKPASDLSMREAALLAAVLPSPNKWRVDPPGPYVSKRAGTLQARMRVVRHQGLDACVFGDARPAALPPVKGEPAPPTETMPDLPDAPDPAPDDSGPDTPVAAGDPLNDVLDAADDTFSRPAPAPSPDEALDPVAQPDLAPAAEPEGQGAPEPAEGGPVDLRPHNDLGLEPEPEPEPEAEPAPQ
ncbi:monofunctional biosynthetic peptidoglycan transglycosylase [Hyphomonas johnsonii]|uniref:Biosynthetic peptidoglycan transglycosylase n=1 Tax=Hyphomonas johnsonii MHS-2 TaxID=1280950 RepID=A0A059FPQ8_9PROT|nr:monofunctional biosynthetic peptidoglycan transglycosylase [Hyphomonas johnsonii]KCZ92665.1 monofunctional biosynthetic peptidoglycan transglycosylase [Hyphomonas johnsonii MHS-2]